MTITLAQINETLVRNDKQIIQNTEESKDYLKSIDAGIKKFLQNQENQRLDNLEDRRENKRLLKLLTPEKSMGAMAADKVKDAGKSFLDNMPNPLEVLGIASLLKTFFRWTGKILGFASAITGLTSVMRTLRESIDTRFNTTAGQDTERLKAQQAEAEELRKKKLAEAEEAGKKRRAAEKQIRDAEKEAKRASDARARADAEERARKAKADRDTFRAAELESREAARTADTVAGQAKIIKKRINKRPMVSRYSRLADDLQIAARIDMGNEELKRFQVRQQNIDTPVTAAKAPKVQTEVSELRQAQAVVAENLDNLPPGVRVAKNGALMMDTPAGPRIVSARDVAPMIQAAPPKPSSIVKGVAGAAADMVNPLADVRDLVAKRGVGAAGKALAVVGLVSSAMDAREAIDATTRENVAAGKDTTRAESTGAGVGGVLGGLAGVLDLGVYAGKSVGRIFSGKTNEQVANEAFGEGSFAQITKDATQAGIVAGLTEMGLGQTAVSKETELARLTGGFTPESYLQALARGSIPEPKGVDRFGKGAPRYKDIEMGIMKAVYSDPNSTDEDILRVGERAKAEYNRQMTEYLLQNEVVQAKLADLQASIDLVEAKYAKATAIREAGQEEAARAAGGGSTAIMTADNSVVDNSVKTTVVDMGRSAAPLSYDTSGGIAGFGGPF